MTHRHVFPVDHIPARAPLTDTVLAYLAMDYYSAPGWIWGSVGALIAFLWLGYVATLVSQRTRAMPGYGEHEDKDDRA